MNSSATPTSTRSYPEPRALWLLRGPEPGAWEALAAGGFPQLTRRLLAARGFRDAAAAGDFLRAGASGFHAPDRMPGVQDACARIETALRQGERVAVLGDYDVDGITSSVLLAKLFGLLKIPHEVYIPDRVSEGYGPNVNALRALKARGASVVVTVDCGTTAFAEALEAKALGLDLIVTDHHLCTGALPEALAIVNPAAREGYPYPALGGVGVAFKFAQALLARLEHPRAPEFLDHMLELVALGTVCDVAPLDGENRCLVREGLKRLREGRWLGLRSLAAAAGVDLKDADAGQLGFQLGPRLNAGGRVALASLGVRLLMSKDAAESRALAAELESLNRERRELEKTILEAAVLRAEGLLAEGRRTLVLWDETWHPGVVGLAASRLLERFHRPVFVFSVQGPLAKGSGRSRAPFHLVDALEACRETLVRFGGHAVAAGATVEAAALPAFAEAFERQAAGLQGEDFRGRREADLEVRFAEIGEDWPGQLEAFEPHGLRNPRPLFWAKGLKLGAGSRTVGADGAHLKLELTQGSAAMAGVAFGFGAKAAELKAAASLEALFHVEWNVWNGRRSLQIQVKDLRPEEAGL